MSKRTVPFDTFGIVQRLLDHLIHVHIPVGPETPAEAHFRFLIRQSFMQIPRDLTEAAIMDGCGKIRYLFSIGIPMALPAITSLAITGFIGAYNMYFWPLLIAQTKNMQTIQIGMAMIQGMEKQQYGSILAGAMICAIIPIILFIFAQDYIIKGLSTGSVKG